MWPLYNCWFSNYSQLKYVRWSTENGTCCVILEEKKNRNAFELQLNFQWWNSILTHCTNLGKLLNCTLAGFLLAFYAFTTWNEGSATTALHVQMLDIVIRIESKPIQTNRRKKSEKQKLNSTHLFNYQRQMENERLLINFRIYHEQSPPKYTYTLFFHSKSDYRFFLLFFSSGFFFLVTLTNVLFCFNTTFPLIEMKLFFFISLFTVVILPIDLKFFTYYIRSFHFSLFTNWNLIECFRCIHIPCFKKIYTQINSFEIVHFSNQITRFQSGDKNTASKRAKREHHIQLTI